MPVVLHVLVVMDTPFVNMFTSIAHSVISGEKHAR